MLLFCLSTLVHGGGETTSTATPTTTTTTRGLPSAPPSDSTCQESCHALVGDQDSSTWNTFCAGTCAAVCGSSGLNYQLPGQCCTASNAEGCDLCGTNADVEPTCYTPADGFWDDGGVATGCTSQTDCTTDGTTCLADGTNLLACSEAADGFYSDGDGKVQACDSACATCSNGSDCLTCRAGDFLNTISYCEACTVSGDCEDNEWLSGKCDGENQNVGPYCANCPTGCTSCTDDQTVTRTTAIEVGTTDCESCDDDYKMNTDTNRCDVKTFGGVCDSETVGGVQGPACATDLNLQCELWSDGSKSTCIVPCNTICKDMTVGNQKEYQPTLEPTENPTPNPSDAPLRRRLNGNGNGNGGSNPTGNNPGGDSDLYQTCAADISTPGLGVKKQCCTVCSQGEVETDPSWLCFELCKVRAVAVQLGKSAEDVFGCADQCDANAKNSGVKRPKKTKKVKFNTKMRGVTKQEAWDSAPSAAASLGVERDAVTVVSVDGETTPPADRRRLSGSNDETVIDYDVSVDETTLTDVQAAVTNTATFESSLAGNMDSLQGVSGVTVEETGAPLTQDIVEPNSGNGAGDENSGDSNLPMILGIAGGAIVVLLLGGFIITKLNGKKADEVNYTSGTTTNA